MATLQLVLLFAVNVLLQRADDDDGGDDDDAKQIWGSTKAQEALLVNLVLMDKTTTWLQSNFLPTDCQSKRMICQLQEM